MLIFKNAIFSNEQLFLKVLVEGKASLFIYVNGNLKRFFYKTADSEINQLIHKRYLIKDKIAYNNYFRQQLLSNLESEIITIQDVRHLKYYKKGLLKLFTKYNDDVNSIYSKNKPKQKKDLFNLSIRPGISVNNFKMHNSSSAWKDFEFDQQIDFKFGIETEFILPFNNNKWSIILEPTYQSYKSKKELITNEVSGGVLYANIDYQSIEIPVGFRYYMHLNKNSKIFANISYLFDFNSDSYIVLSRENGSTYDSLEIKPSGNIAFGMGYKFKDKYSFEIRYLTTRDLLHEYVNWNADYKALTITFGYSIF
jgi:outer membrane protein with beta-barrel domain